MTCLLTDSLDCLKVRIKTLPGIARVLEHNPPDDQWKFQTQKNPPEFGWATQVSERRLQAEVERRRPHCQDVIARSKDFCSFVPGKVSLVVLSCKRWKTLGPLLTDMKPFFSQIERAPYLEKTLFDNGSGPELLDQARATGVFDRIHAEPNNLGMIGALRKAFSTLDGEYIHLLEDDFLVRYDRPYLDRCLKLFQEFPEIGIIRLKNQNNWWKPQRIIGPQRETSLGDRFWTWIPSPDGKWNGWCAGSVLFRKAAYFSTGELPDVPQVQRKKKTNHAWIYEYEYGKKFNERWLAAKMADCTPFVQPNDNLQSPGWT